MNPEVFDALTQAIKLAGVKVGGRGALARELECSTETIRKWGLGEREPSLGQAAQLFALAGTPLAVEHSAESRALVLLDLKPTDRPPALKSSVPETISEDLLNDLFYGLDILEGVVRGTGGMLPWQRGVEDT